MLLILLLPDESFGKNTVVLVNKALIIAYKATNNYCTLENQTEFKPETLLLIFYPLIYKVLSLKPELEQNMLPFTFAWKCLLQNRLPRNAGNNKSQFMKLHMNYHATISNHLILETKP